MITIRPEPDIAADERDLVVRATGGDVDAFFVLIDRHDRALRGLAYRLLGDQHAMDDALQESYLKAFRAVSKFSGDSAFKSWLYRIVYNTCLDELRRKRWDICPSNPYPTTPMDAPIPQRSRLRRSTSPPRWRRCRPTRARPCSWSTSTGWITTPQRRFSASRGGRWRRGCTEDAPSCDAR